MITKEQFDAANKIVKEYRRQQLELHYPKVNTYTAEYEGFKVIYTITQVSPRKYHQEAYVLFTKSLYRFSNFQTLCEVRLITNKFNSPIPNIEEKLNEPKTYLVLFLINKLRTEKVINAEVLNRCIKEYSDQWPNGELRAEVHLMGGAEDWKVYVPHKWAYWMHNLELTKLHKQVEL